MSSGLPPEYGVAPPLHEMPKTRKGPWIFFLVVALLAVVAAIYGGRLISAVNESDGSVPGRYQEPPPPPTPTPAAKRVVVFEVPGPGKAFNVTATVGSTVRNEMNVTLPWMRTVEVPAGEPSASVMFVVVAGPDGAEVHGKYTIDGTTVREGKASGPHGVLTLTDS